MKRTAIIDSPLCFPFLKPIVGLILDYVDSNKPISGKNTVVSDAPAGGRSIDAKAAGAITAGDTLVWSPYLSPPVGTPAADQAFRMRIRQGSVNGEWIPSNENVEILVPSNSLSPFFVWLKASLDENGKITALSYGWGYTLPMDSDDGGSGGGSGSGSGDGSDNGRPPSTVYTLLFFVTTSASGINFPNETSIPQYQSTSLSLIPVVTAIKLLPSGAMVAERKMIWLGSGFPLAALPTFDEIFIDA